MFASLLDADRGGYYKIAPDRYDYVSRQLYLPDTAILVTRFMTPDGVGEVHDFMPVAGTTATDRHRIVRNIRVVRGVMRFAIEVQPRFDYGRASHKLELTADGAVFQSDGLELTLHAIAPPGMSGTFSLCTFWYVDALARAGRLEEARLVFEKMFTYANHLGLYSEEIDSTGGQLGNFPQAFSHLALISAAVNLDHQLDHGPGSLDQAITAR